MVRRTLNLGILAHVDAGKTTLTERLLYEAGVIDEIGSVDAGTTQTDSLELERRRGITIRAAVVSFPVDDVDVNLIDTPGHPDFIAEVERALSVLDGAVLVISAVEGVQPQTRILVRALQRLRIPTLIFVNKIDRPGADDRRVLQAISERLTSAIVPMGTVAGLGTRVAAFTPFDADDRGFRARLVELLAERDDRLLAAYVEDESAVPYSRLRAALAEQVEQAHAHPVFFGSALTGAGVEALTAGISELLPASAGDPDGPVSAAVFKIERGGGAKIAYVRMFSGTIRTRDRVPFGRGLVGKVTTVAVFERGRAMTRPSVSSGAVAKLWGLAEVQVGDRVGEPDPDAAEYRFPPPTLESVVAAADPGDRARLRIALGRLAEQDPLIDVRQDDIRGETSVSLYGEVQKEVVQATLSDEFGVDVTFRETTAICVERPVGTGASVRRMHEAPNPFLATIGLRVDPGAPGSGVEFRLEAELGSMPLAFFRAVEDTVRDVLKEGLHGWEVIDCVVTMTHSGYLGKHGLGHQDFNKSISSTGEDFRKLTPPVLMSALHQAQTVVCEPVHRFRLEAPADRLGAVLSALARLQAVPRDQATDGVSAVIEGDIPAGRVHDLRQQLPTLTRGEGLVESALDRFEPVAGSPPTRRRTTVDPLDFQEYVVQLARRANHTTTAAAGDQPVS
ncbi:MAG: GTP-binding protein [Gaiellaceae bacterium]